MKEHRVINPAVGGSNPSFPTVTVVTQRVSLSKIRLMLRKQEAGSIPVVHPARKGTMVIEV